MKYPSTPWLLQDECKGLSTYLSNAPHARLHVREACAAIQKAKQSMVTVLTSEILRSIADTLVPFNGMHRYVGEYYICISAVNFHCKKAVQELLQEGGLADLTGCLGYPNGSKEYDNNAMSVRFMYLEFLALYLESEQLQ